MLTIWCRNYIYLSFSTIGLVLSQVRDYTRLSGFIFETRDSFVNLIRAEDISGCERSVTATVQRNLKSQYLGTYFLA